jgi:hypothetical protein
MPKNGADPGLKSWVGIKNHHYRDRDSPVGAGE